jgi:hypothetical protein
MHGMKSVFTIKGLCDRFSEAGGTYPLKLCCLECWLQVFSWLEFCPLSLSSLLNQLVASRTSGRYYFLPLSSSKKGSLFIAVDIVKFVFKTCHLVYSMKKKCNTKSQVMEIISTVMLFIPKL